MEVHETDVCGGMGKAWLSVQSKSRQYLAGQIQVGNACFWPSLHEGLRRDAILVVHHSVGRRAQETVVGQVGAHTHELLLT